MYYVYIEWDDAYGDGRRADLHALSSRAEADAFWADQIARDVNHDITDMKMFEGKELRHYQLNEDTDRTLSDNDLQTSTLEDVDNLSDKENV